MGYVPPYVADQKMIYGRRDEAFYSSYKLRLHPVERIQYKNINENDDGVSYSSEKVDTPGRSFRKILSDLTGKGQNINEVI